MNDAFLRLLDVAKALTGSSDIDQLIASAKKLHEAMQSNSAMWDQVNTYIETGNVYGELVDFMRECKIQHPQQGAIPFVPYPFQAEVAKKLSSTPESLILINSSRQMGITAMTAAYALHAAVNKNDQRILIVSNKLNSAMEILQRIMFMNDTTHLLLPKIIQRSKTQFEFDNGSRIITSACSSHAGRGLSLTHMIMDQAAYISHSVAEDFFISMRPTMSMGGKMLITSTPNLDQGLFARLWLSTEVPAERITVNWKDHPERDILWQEQMMSQLGPVRFAQEFDNQFIAHTN